MSKRKRPRKPPVMLDYAQILARAGKLPCHPSVVERVQKMPDGDWWIVDFNGVKFLVVARP